MSKTKSTSSRLGKWVWILATILILAIGGGYAYYIYMDTSPPGKPQTPPK
jgi:hypothetical protein